jgi:hypothetical protein
MSISNWDEVLRCKEAIINGEAVADIWDIDAVKEIALDYNHNGDMATGVDYALSTAQAKKVLACMKAYYDPNFGIYNMSVFGNIDHVLGQESKIE